MSKKPFAFEVNGPWVGYPFRRYWNEVETRARLINSAWTSLGKEKQVEKHKEAVEAWLEACEQFVPKEAAK